MTVARQRLGRAAEELAARRLARTGFTILARNARVRTHGVVGEIDLVERPALAVDRRKQLRLRRLAGAWLASAGALPRFAALRFDVVGVRLDGARVVAYEHLRGAF